MLMAMIFSLWIEDVCFDCFPVADWLRFHARCGLNRGPEGLRHMSVST
jgi:hypothetical protein